MSPFQGLQWFRFSNHRVLPCADDFALAGRFPDCNPSLKFSVFFEQIVTIAHFVTYNGRTDFFDDLTKNLKNEKCITW